ncbi:hypothetical protein Van01_63200 [Micromonospora andamanensis]|uniref:Uncharacterized protein n=1 Tax=Micromonospora andamanensis TaxID=1287068 RepID=A0ABQ4I5C5_9ACTN|nr:hypothetical protein Van01_63200 [Micromonospora andamanensis]
MTTLRRWRFGDLVLELRAVFRLSGGRDDSRRHPDGEQRTVTTSVGQGRQCLQVNGGQQNLRDAHRPKDRLVRAFGIPDPALTDLDSDRALVGSGNGGRGGPARVIASLLPNCSQFKG